MSSEQYLRVVLIDEMYCSVWYVVRNIYTEIVNHRLDDGKKSVIFRLPLPVGVEFLVSADTSD